MQITKIPFVMAGMAYCEKHYDFARLLIQLAAEVLEHAGGVAISSHGRRGSQ
jgi:hypothetical protein